MGEGGKGQEGEERKGKKEKEAEGRKLQEEIQGNGSMTT